MTSNLIPSRGSMVEIYTPPTSMPPAQVIIAPQYVYIQEPQKPLGAQAPQNFLGAIASIASILASIAVIMGIIATHSPNKAAVNIMENTSEPQYEYQVQQPQPYCWFEEETQYVGQQYAYSTYEPIYDQWGRYVGDRRLDWYQDVYRTVNVKRCEYQ